MHRLLVIGATGVVALAFGGTASAWSWPADGQILRPFVLDGNAYAAGQHRGIDVAGADGSSVRAPASGTVTFAGSLPTHGRGVTIVTADGYAVTLVHLGSVAVAKGDSVAEGAPVGTMGSSGEPEHPVSTVHLGIRVASQPEGYLDPLGLLPPRAAVPSPPQAPSAQAPAPASAAAPAAPISSQAQPPAAAPSGPPVSQKPVAAAPPPVAASGPASATPGTDARTTAPVSASSAAFAAGPSVPSPAAPQASSSAAGDAERPVLSAPGVPPPAATGRAAGIAVQAARGGPVGVAAESPTVRSPAPAGTPGGSMRADPASGARAPMSREGAASALRPGASSSRAREGEARRRVAGAPDARRTDSGRAVEPVVSVTTTPSGEDALRHPGARLPRAVAQTLGPRDAHRPVGAHGSTPEPAAPVRHAAGWPGRDIAVIGALAVLALLLAVAAGRKEARRIGADGALLRHHADLLRQLHAAYRARVHDRGSGRLRAPSAATRP